MKIKDLLNKPEKWTREASAKDKKGNVVASDAKNAVCWCLIGATVYCYGEDVVKKFEVYQKMEDWLKDNWRFAPGYKDPLVIADFNDHKETTFSDIQKLLVECDV